MTPCLAAAVLPVQGARHALVPARRRPAPALRRTRPCSVTTSSSSMAGRSSWARMRATATPGTAMALPQRDQRRLSIVLRGNRRRRDCRGPRRRHPASVRTAGSRPRADTWDPDRPAGPWARGERQLHRLLLESRPWDAVLFRRLRDRFRSHPRRAGQARRLGMGRLAGARVHNRRRVAGGRDRQVAPLHRIGDGDDGDGHVDPDPPRRRRVEDQVRYLPACGGSHGRVRADPAGHPVPLDHAPDQRSLDPGRLRRPGPGPGAGLDEAHVARPRGARADVEASNQLAIRITVLLVFGLLASRPSSGWTSSSAASSPG